VLKMALLTLTVLAIGCAADPTSKKRNDLPLRDDDQDEEAVGTSESAATEQEQSNLGLCIKVVDRSHDAMGPSNHYAVKIENTCGQTYRLSLDLKGMPQPACQRVAHHGVARFTYVVANTKADPFKSWKKCPDLPEVDVDDVTSEKA
jgi:hypothetical protein